MRSDCIAAWPQSTCCSYTWKLPVTPQMRPVLLDKTHTVVCQGHAKARPESSKPEHAAIPWKTYLATREFKNLASDLADAVFSPISSGLSSTEAERPASLNASAFCQAAGSPSAGSLLASVLPEAEDAPLKNADKQVPGLALAA